MKEEDILQELKDISFIVASYNGDRWLKQCLDSIFSQSIQNMEVIIVDDNSLDQSRLIAEKYRTRYPDIPVNIIFKNDNEGTFLSRIDGMRQAKGKYLCFVDHDDYINDYGEAIQTALLYNVDILEFDYQLISSKQKKIYSRILGGTKPPAEKLIYMKDGCFNLLKYEIFPSLYIRIYSKNLIDKVVNIIENIPDYRKKFEHILNEDEFLMPLFFLRANTFFYLDKKLYNYRYLNPEGTMHTRSINIDRHMRGMKEYLYARHFVADVFLRNGVISIQEAEKYNKDASQVFVKEARKCNYSWRKIYSILKEYYNSFKAFEYMLKGVIDE